MSVKGKWGNDRKEERSPNGDQLVNQLATLRVDGFLGNKIKIKIKN